MSFVAAAATVGGAVGLSGTAAIIGGGALLGAGAGGLYSAITKDGSIGQSMLNGALLGGAGAGIGSALGLGSTAAGGASAGASAIPGAAGAVTPGLGAAPVATGSIGNAAGADYFAGLAGTSPSATVLPNVSSGIGNLATADAASYGPGWSSAGFNGGPNSISNLIENNPSALKYAGYGLGALGLGAMMNKDNSKYGTFTQDQVTTNPLPYPSNYGTYQPLDTSIMRRMGTPPQRMANGGIAMANQSIGPVEQMSRDNALGNNQMFPQAIINSPSFATATNRPMSENIIGAGDTNVDPYTGAERFAEGGTTGFYAQGGVSHLGGYSDGGRMLKGPGDGMSDNIPATIGGKQPARLADGEFVVPADVVSHLGNGSTDAGAKHLYSMMDKVRKARTGSKKQGKQIKADKLLPK